MTLAFDRSFLERTYFPAKRVIVAVYDRGFNEVGFERERRGSQTTEQIGPARRACNSDCDIVSRACYPDTFMKCSFYEGYETAKSLPLVGDINKM